ncbi:MAG: hypothetical protein JXB36_04700 [Gammaproteobacteria bacterium]|nr:hypothetical protein [Gammaproteobacteria bacterium]
MAVHVLAAFLATRAWWPAVPGDEPVVLSVVWLEDVPQPAAKPDPEPEPAAEIAPEPEVDPELRPIAEVEPESEPEIDDRIAERTVADTEVPPAEGEARAEPEPLPAPEPASAGDRDAQAAPEGDEPATEADRAAPPRTFIVREIDWEEERRRAVDRVSEQLQQEDRYMTFSLADVVEEPPPEEPGTVEDIFEAAERGGGSNGPALLTPGRSGGPVGRRITALCDVLGGIGLSLQGFGVGSLCAEREAYTLFAEIKPNYLRARPECTEVPGAEAPSGISAGTGDPTVKCRLVPIDESASARPADDLYAEQGTDAPAGSAEPVAPDSRASAPEVAGGAR